MSDLHVIKGGRDYAHETESSAINLHNADHSQFGPPPSLLVGIVTAILGAAVGVVSLLIFFKLWQPEPYISPQWLSFIILGAIFGFFLRLERPLVKALDPASRELE